MSNLGIIKLVFKYLQALLSVLPNQHLASIQRRRPRCEPEKKTRLLDWEILVVDFAMGIHAALFYYVDLQNIISRKIKEQQVYVYFCNLHKNKSLNSTCIKIIETT